MIRRLFFGALMVAAAALSGCASLEPIGPQEPLPQGARNYADDVTLAGRLSLRYPVDGKTQSVQGKFQWRQRRDNTDIELYSPLGQTLARITIVPGFATLEQSGGMRRAATNVDALTEDTLGWPLPVAGLRYWLQGFVRASDGRLQAARPQAPEQFVSDGWQLSYPLWQPNGTTAVPKRVDAVRGDIALRLVIDQWQDGP